MGVIVVTLAVDVQSLEDKGNAVLRLVIDVHWRHVKSSIDLDKHRSAQMLHARSEGEGGLGVPEMRPLRHMEKRGAG
jgi:hypothetical protein